MVNGILVPIGKKIIILFFFKKKPWVLNNCALPLECFREAERQADSDNIIKIFLFLMPKISPRNVKKNSMIAEYNLLLTIVRLR